MRLPKVKKSFSKPPQFTDAYPDWVTSIAEKLNLPEDMVGEALDQYWWAVRFSIENDTLPQIKIGDLGRMRVQVGELEYSMRLAGNVKRRKTKETAIDVSHIYIRFHNMWKVRRRMYKELTGKIYRHTRRKRFHYDWAMKAFLDYAPHWPMAFWRRLTAQTRPYRAHMRNPSGRWDDAKYWAKGVHAKDQIRAVFDEMGVAYDPDEYSPAASAFIKGKEFRDKARARLKEERVYIPLPEAKKK